MDTRFQRDTQTLALPQVKQQIIDMHKAAVQIQRGNYQPVIKQLQDITLKLEEKPYDVTLMELKFQRILAGFYSVNYMQTENNKIVSQFWHDLQELDTQINNQIDYYLMQQEQEEWPQADDIKIRIYTVFLQMEIKGFTCKEYPCQDKLIDLLKKYPQKVPEVLGKLCGCKNIIEFMKNFNEDEFISSNTKTQIQKAEIFNIAANWIIIGGSLQRGINCKVLSVQLWKKCNRLEEYNTCLQELKELKGEKSSGEYLEKISKISEVVQQITDQVILAGFRSKKQGQVSSIIVRKGIHKVLPNLQIEKPQQVKLGFFASKKQKQKASSLKKSVLSAKDKFDSYHNKCKQISEIYSKEKNNEITSILLDSKYIIQHKKKFLIIIKPILTLEMKRYRNVFNHIKNIYIIKHGIMDKKFLSQIGKPNDLIGGMTSKKNFQSQYKFKSVSSMSQSQIGSKK